MTRFKIAAPAFFIMVLVCLPVCIVNAQSLKAERDIPGMIDPGKVKFQIVGAIYVTEFKGVNATFTESSEDISKYHGLILTVKIRKPADESITLNAQDLPLHYKYGDKSDIAPCMCISSFSVQQDVDRPMRFFKANRGNSTTGASTIRADEVYVDLFYMYMEPDTSELYLLVAQPAGAFFRSQGWK